MKTRTQTKNSKEFRGGFSMSFRGRIQRKKSAQKSEEEVRRGISRMKWDSTRAIRGNSNEEVRVEFWIQKNSEEVQYKFIERIQRRSSRYVQRRNYKGTRQENLEEELKEFRGGILNYPTIFCSGKFRETVREKLRRDFRGAILVILTREDDEEVGRL